MSASTVSTVSTEFGTASASGQQSRSNSVLPPNAFNSQLLHKESIVKPDEYLRAAALNDLYTLRKFYDFECRYAWGQKPVGPRDVPVDPKVAKAEAKAAKKAKKAKKKHGEPTPQGDVHSKDDFGTDATEHLKGPARYRTPHGENALHLACAYGNFRALKFIFEKGGMDVNDLDNDGFNCVHHAVLGGNLDCLKWVVKKGGDWKKIASNSARGRGETPFMLAVRCHRKTIVDYFLRKFEIDFKQTNAELKTVHGIAIDNGRPGMIWLMRKKTDEPKSQIEIDHIRKMKLERMGQNAVVTRSHSSSSGSLTHSVTSSKSKSSQGHKTSSSEDLSISKSSSGM